MFITKCTLIHACTLKDIYKSCVFHYSCYQCYGVKEEIMVLQCLLLNFSKMFHNVINIFTLISVNYMLVWLIMKSMS